MRGAVLHYDKDQDYGYINGVDGKRYFFTRNDLTPGVALVSGALVEFQPDDGAAHNIVTASSAAPSSPPGQPSRTAENQPTRSTGLWGYFRNTVSVNYFNFNGRARRKEFWAFWLCFNLVLVALLGFGILVNLAVNGFGINAGRTSIGFLPAAVFALAFGLPWIALTVRRLHDVGVSGWFVLPCFIPAIGAVALPVLGLAPSQVGENPWGPVPAGVRV
ncbi:DUF805 domain-containing protein [Mesorhizobium sp. CO1-1-8]|uniref:DUF805 domain-containing protein n=1 Tax=Mesorhizobium sp. CO1-1-8 TaxID=2876631 RepID=UPI001CD04610|nr:DUF805 domain-containing protein [Mesorhizobium sp. CO1-1-8]MBZ9773064.1 DUF805 domain-containing protein [Mesorhizobium sp. CO1-1-8]